MTDPRPLMVKKIERLLLLGSSRQLTQEQGDTLIAYQELVQANFIDIQADVWVGFQRMQNQLSVVLKLSAGIDIERRRIRIKWTRDMTPGEVWETL